MCSDKVERRGEQRRVDERRSEEKGGKECVPEEKHFRSQLPWTTHRNNKMGNGPLEGCWCGKNVCLGCGQKKAWELRDKIQRLFNPRFHSLHLHTVRTWTREGNIQSPVTEHIFAREQLPDKKTHRVRYVTGAAFAQQVFDLSTR